MVTRMVWPLLGPLAHVLAPLVYTALTSQVPGVTANRGGPQAASPACTTSASDPDFAHCHSNAPTPTA